MESTQVVTLLSQKSIHKALLAKINEEKFPGRNLYVGGSEVGGCSRQVAWKKVDPTRTIITDPHSAGRMLAGRDMENTVVQLVRDAFDGAVRETGRAQVELSHETAPLRSHPDGRLTWSVEWVEGMKLAYVDEKGKEQMQDAPPDGPGSKEIKTASSGMFRKIMKEGLSDQYVDQTQVEMGLSGTKWCLLVLVNREDIAQFVSFLIFFDQARYETCVTRSRVIMNAVNLILLDPSTEAELLPAGEPERGWCQYCDHEADCPAMNEKAFMDPTATFPEDVAIEFAVWAEELHEIKDDADAAGKRVEELKKKMKEAMIEFHVEASDGFFLAKSAGRTGFDTKGLEAESPDIYLKFKKTGDPVYSLKPAKSIGKSASKARKG
jgi:hypothetical protein